MSNGQTLSHSDLKWQAAAGVKEVELAVATLTGVALWWAYEASVQADTRDMLIAEDGSFLIQLNDDANPPGWYHYKMRLASEALARAAVAEKYGDRVRVPITAALSEKSVED